MIRDFLRRIRRGGQAALLEGRVHQSLWLEVVFTATVASALMALVSGFVVLHQSMRQLTHDSDDLQRRISAGFTSYRPLHSLQRELQQITSGERLLSALVVDQRGLVLAAANNALVGLPIAHVLQLPNQALLRQLFDECPSVSTLLSCLTRDDLVFHGPIPWIGGEAVLSMHPYPLALEGSSRFGDRATLITVMDARTAGHDALVFILTVFLAGLLPLSAGSVGLMLRLRQKLIPELLRLAQVDALSEVFNRRAFLETAGDLVGRARSAGLPMALAMIDVDHFKQINDNHGHESGDQVIRSVSRLLRGAIRSTDIVGRLGGDEFVILVQLPGEQGTLMLERTLAEVRSTSIPLPDGGSAVVTLSIGVAATDLCQSHDLGNLMGEADAALYVAKDRGRNQVVNLQLEAQCARGKRPLSRLGDWQVRGA